MRLGLASLPRRFASKVRLSPHDGCWIWIASKGRGGYGQFWDGSTMARAHRYSYTALVGPIPDGLELDHLCHVRHCVNPEHLEPVTQAVNQFRRRKYPNAAAKARAQRARDRARREQRRIESGWWVHI